MPSMCSMLLTYPNSSASGASNRCTFWNVGNIGHGKNGPENLAMGKIGHGKNGHRRNGHGKNGHGKNGHGRNGHGKYGHGIREIVWKRTIGYSSSLLFAVSSRAETSEPAQISKMS